MRRLLFLDIRYAIKTEKLSNRNVDAGSAAMWESVPLLSFGRHGPEGTYLRCCPGMDGNQGVAAIQLAASDSSPDCCI